MGSVYDSFTSWLEETVRGRRLRGLVALPSTVGAVLAIIALIAGWTLASNISLMLVTVWLALCVAALAIDRRNFRRLVRERDDALRGYANSIRSLQEVDRDYFHTLSWDEEVLVGHQGDSTITRKLLLRTNLRPVQVLWAISSRDSEDHLAPAIKDRVKVSAHYLNSNGELGARIVTSKSWEPDARLRVYMHFDRPIAPRTEVPIRLRIDWPQYYRNVLDGVTEVVHWTARRPTGHLRSTYVFERAFSKAGLAVTALPGSPQPEVSVNETAGSTRIHLDLSEIEVNREYGYRLSLNES